MNMGAAYKTLFKRGHTEEQKQRLTVDATHIVKALKANRDQIKETGYTLQVIPYTFKNRNAVTGYLYGVLYEYGTPATKKAVVAQVEKDFDSNTWNSIEENHTVKALEAEANKTLNDWVNLFANDQKGFYDKVPKGLSKLVMNFWSKGSNLAALKEAKADTKNQAKA